MADASTIAQRLAAVRGKIDEAARGCGRDPGEVELLAVSKRHPSARVRDAMAAGQAIFGENRVQELMTKAEEMAAEGVRWHMIGSLQTNKVKHLLRVEGLELLHTVDRAKLADGLQEQLNQQERELAVLIQVNATGEGQKHGVHPDAAPELLDHLLSRCPRLIVRGLMAMGPLGGEPRPVFDRVAELRNELRECSALGLPVLSLGMTDDLSDAIAAGSTLVRVGTAVFGPRQ